MFCCDSDLGEYFEKITITAIYSGFDRYFERDYCRPFISGSLFEQKPLSTLFIKLIITMLAPIIFASVVVDISLSNNIKNTNEVDVKFLLHFEITSTIFLLMGMAIVDIIKPGKEMNIDPASLDASAIKTYANAAAQGHSAMDFIFNIIPNTVVGTFASSKMITVIFFSILFSVAISKLDHDKAGPFLVGLDTFLHAMFTAVKIVMSAAPPWEHSVAWRLPSTPMALAFRGRSRN
jgi:DAACS family dicarboxylate/amino acid:cation (Na+ or H+) symporter/aerobic C4-dicarboxylate transport protein